MSNDREIPEHYSTKALEYTEPVPGQEMIFAVTFKSTDGFQVLWGHTIPTLDSFERMLEAVRYGYRRRREELLANPSPECNKAGMWKM
jgi:hypothetical protein